MHSGEGGAKDAFYILSFLGVFNGQAYMLKVKTVISTMVTSTREYVRVRKQYFRSIHAYWNDLYAIHTYHM